ncbi:2-methylcitrate dehydratase PrpD, partial [Laetiporus sulphureus 93-53]
HVQPRRVCRPSRARSSALHSQLQDRVGFSILRPQAQGSLIDTIGCGLEGFDEECARFMGPAGEGTIVPNGTRVPGARCQVYPIYGAFNVGTQICFLAHPSDDLGAVLAIADRLACKGEPLTGMPFEFQMPYGSYSMQNVLFKISYLAEFHMHEQTAMEAAHILHNKLKAMGKNSDDIKSIRIGIQEAAMLIINKKGPWDNFADRDHTPMWQPPILAFMPSTRRFRVEEKWYSVDYHDPSKRSISNVLLVTLNDGTVLIEGQVEYPVGHKRRRAEDIALLMQKFKNHIGPHFDVARQKKFVIVPSVTPPHPADDL